MINTKLNVNAIPDGSIEVSKLSQELQESIETIPTKTSDLENDSNLINQEQLTEELGKLEFETPLVNFSTPTVNLVPNKMYVSDFSYSNLSINLVEPENTDIVNEYIVKFPCQSTSVSLPNNIKWVNSMIPDFEDGYDYTLSFIDNQGIFGKFKSLTKTENKLSLVNLGNNEFQVQAQSNVDSDITIIYTINTGNEDYIFTIEAGNNLSNTVNIPIGEVDEYNVVYVKVQPPTSNKTQIFPEVFPTSNIINLIEGKNGIDVYNYFHNTVLNDGLMTVPTKSRIVINGLDVTWIYLENTNIIFQVVDGFYKLDSTGYVETYDYVVPLNV